VKRGRGPRSDVDDVEATGVVSDLPSQDTCLTREGDNDGAWPGVVADVRQRLLRRAVYQLLDGVVVSPHRTVHLALGAGFAG
jgi:hypothetical protein